MKHLVKKISAFIMVMVFIANAVLSTNIYQVKADNTVLTSDKISIVGYQMKTNPSSAEGISFRTVCKAPDVGSIITVGGKNYKITALGTIYTKDPNTTGYHENNKLNKEYTELNPIPYSQESLRAEYGFKYVGNKSYEGMILTFGYIATEQGVIEKKDGYTSYIRTMTNMDEFVMNSLYIRAFVTAVDEKGNEVIIYSEEVSKASVASIASLVYVKGMAPDEAGHKYLFNSILHKLPDTNPFYKENMIDYGWSEIIKPN